MLPAIQQPDATIRVGERACLPYASVAKTMTVRYIIIMSSTSLQAEAYACQVHNLGLTYWLT